MAVCGACGTENRDKARFCLGCAKALAPLVDSAPADAGAAAAVPVAPAPGPVQTCPACQTANPLAATVCKSCRSSLVPDLAKPAPPPEPPARRGVASKAAAGVALGMVAVAVWWFGVKEGASNPPAMAGVPALSKAGSPDAQPVRVGTPATLGATAAPPPQVESGVAAQTERSAQEKAASEEARIKRQAAAKARRDHAAGERAAAEEQARLAKVQEQQRADEAARQKAAAETAQLARAARATPPPPPAPVAKTVEQTCASSGNFFSREVCRLRSCGNAALASDPVCVRFREMEESSRQAVSN
jgi:hypothetical protein